MNALIRLALAVAVVVPVTVGIIGLCFSWGLADVRGLLRASRREEELERLQRATSHRLEFRQQVVREVIAQRCSLRDALSRFEELDREWPDAITALSKKQYGPGWSEPERNYQYVVAVVEDLLSDRPEETAAVLRRLAKDYQQLQAGRPALAPPLAEQTEWRR